MAHDLQPNGVSFDYTVLAPDVAQMAREDAAAIRAHTDEIYQRYLDIGARLDRQRAALSGHFRSWLASECQFKHAQAYRIIRFYLAYKDDPRLGDYQTSITTLMRLATIEEDTRAQILDIATQTKLTGSQVDTLIAHNQTMAEEAHARALADASPTVRAICTQYGVTDTGTITELNEWERRGLKLLGEVAATGVIQIGDEEETIAINAGAEAVINARKARTLELRRQAARSRIVAEHRFYARARIEQGEIILSPQHPPAAIQGDVYVHIGVYGNGH